MKKISLIVVALVVSGTIHANGIDGNAVLGSMVGAGVGSAVGSSAGGRDGAIIGGGVGGALGAAIGSSNQNTRSGTRVVTQERVITRDRVVYVDDHHDNGRHRGHYKDKHRHGHGRD